MAQKLNRDRKSQIRNAVRHFVIQKLEEVITAGHPSSSERDYEVEFAKQWAAEIRRALPASVAMTNAVPCDPYPTDEYRPGLAEIREELRRAGIQEELIDGQAKQLWHDRQRAGQLGGGQ